MIYNVTNEIESEVRSNNFMPPGIHENCEFKNTKDATKYPIEFGVSAKGKKFAAFHFVNSKNETLIHTEWEPFDEDETKLTNKTLNQIKRFKHIITKFVPKEAFEGFSVNNFEEFVRKSIQILGNAHVGKKVRLKVTLNNANYTSLPNYISFIEPMSVSKEDSVLSINTAMDKMVKDRPDTEVSSNTNPFATEVKSTDLALAKTDLSGLMQAVSPQLGENDLPF